MKWNRDKLYLFLLFFCLAGSVWIYANFTFQEHTGISVYACLFKQLTSIPCPSCGSTRSAISLLQGHFSDALHLNPMGFLLLAYLFLIPVWILTDWITKRDTLYRVSAKCIQLLQKKPVASALILLILVNWIWNIFKEL